MQQIVLRSASHQVINHAPGGGGGGEGGVALGGSLGRGVPPRSGGNSQMKRAGMLVQTIVTYHTFLLALIIFGITSFIGNDSFSSSD